MYRCAEAARSLLPKGDTKKDLIALIKKQITSIILLILQMYYF